MSLVCCFAFVDDIVVMAVIDDKYSQGFLGFIASPTADDAAANVTTSLPFESSLYLHLLVTAYLYDNRQFDKVQICANNN